MTTITRATVVKIREPVIAEEDGVRELHGIQLADNSIIIDENGDRIRFRPLNGERYITARQARYLASKLYRLARRIERREVGE